MSNVVWFVCILFIIYFIFKSVKKIIKFFLFVVAIGFVVYFISDERWKQILNLNKSNSNIETVITSIDGRK